MIFGFTLQDKFGLFIATIIIVIISALSFFFYLQLESAVMDSLRSKLMTVSKLVAHHVDAESVSRILKGDERSSEYWKLKKYLKGVALMDSKIKSIYVMVRTDKDNIWKFVADEDLATKTMAHLNEEYDVKDLPEMQKAFAGSSADRVTSSDKWGRWLSGYSPIMNRQGYPAAIVGVDMAASDVDDLRANTRSVVMFSFMVGLILAVIFGRIGAVTITNPLMALLAGVKNLEQGRYGYQVDIHRKDEIGSLVNGFNQMSQKLGEVDKMKSDFLSVITHELYTPITPIKDGVSQLKADPTLSPSGQQLLGIIDRQVNKMQSLVDEVLDFSWLEIRDWKLEKEPVELKGLGAKLLEGIREQASAKKIDLSLKLGEDLPAMLIDRKRVQHVLRILLDNAVKFTPENGKVALEINKVSGGVEFAVSDTGIGISKKDTERIFSGFYQVEDHMTRTQGGMGLGLAIAKRIVEAHNGYIWAESPGLGEGSRFIFLLPIV